MQKTSEHKTPTELRAAASSGGGQVVAGMDVIHAEPDALDMGCFDPDTPLEVDFG